MASQIIRYWCSRLVLCVFYEEICPRRQYMVYRLSSVKNKTHRARKGTGWYRTAFRALWTPYILLRAAGRKTNKKNGAVTTPKESVNIYIHTNQPLPRFVFRTQRLTHPRLCQYGFRISSPCVTGVNFFVGFCISSRQFRSKWHGTVLMDKTQVPQRSI